MEIACLDLEGVLVPEIWIAFAEKTGIEALKATTRDIPDYDVLMKQRLRILDEHGLKLKDIQEVIATLKPLEGAVEFVDWLRERFQVVILSDTTWNSIGSLGSLGLHLVDDSFPLKPQRIVAEIRAALDDEDIVLVDTGAIKIFPLKFYFNLISLFDWVYVIIVDEYR